MKKIISIMMMLMIVMLPIKAFALNEKAAVNVRVNGELKAGKEVEIIVEVENIDKLYAISTDFQYDTSKLKVISIEGGSFIKGNGQDQMEVPTKIENGVASYGITLIGDVEGRKGGGNITKIKAKVLKDNQLNISKGNFNIKLVEKTNATDVKAINYKLNVIAEKQNEGESDPPQTNDNNNTIEKPSEDTNNVQKEEIEVEEEKDQDDKVEDKDNKDEDINENESESSTEKSEEETDKEQSENEENKSAKSNKSIVYIIGGLIIIVASGTAVYFTKRKSRK